MRVDTFSPSQTNQTRRPNSRTIRYFSEPSSAQVTYCCSKKVSYLLFQCRQSFGKKSPKLSCAVFKLFFHLVLGLLTFSGELTVTSAVIVSNTSTVKPPFITPIRWWQSIMGQKRVGHFLKNAKTHCRLFFFLLIFAMSIHWSCLLTSTEDHHFNPFLDHFQIQSGTSKSVVSINNGLHLCCAFY